MSAVMPEKVLVTDLKNGVKVCADWPHLVSFGGGRLSTAVTILPLKDGLTTLGSSPDRDIVVAGTGVQRDHCRIRNDDGFVILEPAAAAGGASCLLTIDGARVERPTILSQGCMICIGRSNYYRFNHPEQAAQLRNILPASSRVSMVPLQYGGDFKNGPSSDDSESVLWQNTRARGGRSSGDARDDVDAREDTSFASKLKRSDPLTLSSPGSSRGGCQGSARELPDGCAPWQAPLPADPFSSSGKPAYLSYVSEKLFAQCASGSAPLSSDEAAAAALEGFYRERRDSNSSSSSSSSSSSGGSTSSSNSEWSGCEVGVQSRHAKAALASASPAATATASASATANAAGDEACLRQGQLLLPLQRRRGLQPGGRTPSYDIKTLSMLSTETSLWGSTSSMATALAADDETGGSGQATPVTPSTERGGGGCADDLFGCGYAEDDCDYVDVLRAPTAVAYRGLARSERQAPSFPLHLPGGAAHLQPLVADAAALRYKHSRSVEERLLAEEAERRERRRLEDILLMCASYERRTDGQPERPGGRSEAWDAMATTARYLIEGSPAARTMVADSAAPSALGRRLLTDDGGGEGAAAAQAKAASATAGQVNGGAKMVPTASAAGISAVRAAAPQAGLAPSGAASAAAATGAVAPQQQQHRPAAPVQPQRATVTVAASAAALGLATGTGSAGGGSGSGGAGSWSSGPVLGCDGDDEEHAYDVPSAPARLAAVADGSRLLCEAPLTAGRQSAAAGAGHGTPEERIYDDPADYVTAVDTSPPVPVRLRASAAVPSSTKAGEVGAAVAPAAALPSVADPGRDPSKIVLRCDQQPLQLPAFPLASQPVAAAALTPLPAATAAVVDARAQLQQLSRSRQEIVQALAALLSGIAEVTRQQESVVRQFELELARMEAEQKDDIDQLQLQAAESVRTKARQLDTLARVAHEQEEEAAKVERARSRMEALEQRRRLLVAEQARRSQRAGGGGGAAAAAEDAGAAADYYTSELEQLESEMKDFEDLEFQQLEVETKFEDEKEDAQRELSRQHRLMQESIVAAEEKLNARIRRQRELLQQAKADAEAAEHRRLALIADFRVHKERLLAADRMMRELDVALASRAGGSGGSSKEASSVATTVALEDDLTWSSPSESSNHTLMLRLKADDSVFTYSRHKLDDAMMAVSEAPSSRAPPPSKAAPPAPSAAAKEREPQEQKEQQRTSAGRSGRTDSEGSSVKSAEAEADKTSLSEADKTSFSGSDDVSDRRSELQRLLAQARAHVENADGGSSFPSQMDVTFASESEGSPSRDHGQLDLSSLDSSSANGDDVRLREKNVASGPQDRPLTRYLPARAAGLDLRTHVEAAGHNVTACSHVIIDDRTCRGYLLKVGYKMKSWNKRWFVFSREQKALVYYADKHDAKPRGHVPFHAIEDVFVDHLKMVKTPHHKPLFCVKTAKRPYHLIAKTPETMSIWIDVIFSGAEGYREF